MEVDDHSADNISHPDPGPGRTQIADNTPTLPIDPQSITGVGKRTYDRELRRSPADNTFRPTNSMNKDWDRFNSAIYPKK